jgi:hypothetical protein
MSKLVKRVCVNGVWFMPGDTPPSGLWPRLTNPAVWEGGIVPVVELKAAEPEVKAVPKKAVPKKAAAKKAPAKKAPVKKVER